MALPQIAMPLVHFADLVWLPGVAGAIGGLITGVVASLVAPWSQWGVEKRRLRREERRKILEAARKLISFSDARSFRDTPECARLRPYLSDKLRKDFEGEAIVVVVGRGRGSPAIWLLDEITQLEKKWGLV
jgi:hypothetical protein